MKDVVRIVSLGLLLLVIAWGCVNLSSCTEADMAGYVEGLSNLVSSLSSLCYFLDRIGNSIGKKWFPMLCRTVQGVSDDFGNESMMFTICSYDFTFQKSKNCEITLNTLNIRHA